MTARLLIGPAGAGKTRRCLQALRDCERAGEAGFLIVPDQFTYAADRLLLEEGALPGTRHVRVLSFRRLARWLAAQTEPVPALISEEGRRLILQAILHELPPPQLGPFERVHRMPGFVAALAETVAEVKGIAGSDAAGALERAGAEGDPAASAGQRAGAGAKASALAAVLRAYDAALASAGLRDPGDWIQALAAALRRGLGPPLPARLWIDGFMSFTPEERALLPALAGRSGETTITLCADGDDARSLLDRARQAADFGAQASSALLAPTVRETLRRPQFLPTLRTALWLQAWLPDLRVETLPAPAGRFEPAGELARLESALFAAAPDAPARPAGQDTRSAPAVSLRVSATPYHEVVSWARLIDARVRLRAAYRYRDWAILVRDLDAYRPLVRDVFGRYGIPVYLDQRRDAAAHPLVRLHLTLLHLASRGWTRELVMELLRNPLLGVPLEAADRIENLALEYGVDRERWLKTDWCVLDLPPRESARGDPGDPGDASGSEDDAGAADGDDEALAGAEEGRDPQGELKKAAMERRRLAAAEARAATGRLFPAARTFTDIWRGRERPFAEAAAALSRAVSSLLAPAEVADGAPRATPADPTASFWTRDETQRISELLRDTLAMGDRLMGATPVGPGQFARLLREGLAGAAIGIAPQALDAVTLADPRRSRVNEARCVILGGLAASAFPREATDDPLLSEAERGELAASGFPIGARASARVEEDPYLFYVACTRAREELFLTRSALDPEGAGAEPSPYLADVERSLGRALAADPDGGLPGEGAPADGCGPLDGCRHAIEVEPALAHTLAGLDRGAEQRVASEACALLAEMPRGEEACARARRMIAYLRSPLPERLDPRLTERLFPERTLPTSASRLETFAVCPFQHFARHILRLEPRPEGVLTPLSTGSAVHAALQRFFALAPRRESAEEAAVRMRAIFDELSREEEFRIFQDDPPSEYRWTVTRRELALFIRTEHRRLSRSLFRPCAVELSFGIAAAGERETAPMPEDLRRLAREGRCLAGVRFPALELALTAEADAPAGQPAAGRVLVRGRIDRIDIQPTEIGPPAALVFDYKRRPPARSPGGELAHGLDLQIATYLLAVDRVLGLAPVAGFYYSVSPQTRTAPVGEDERNPYGFELKGFRVAAADGAIDPEQVLIGPRMRGGLEKDLGGVLGEVRERIAAHATRVLSGEIRPAPVERGGRLPCDACDFCGVCRFDATALRVPGAPFGDEDDE